MTSLWSLHAAAKAEKAKHEKYDGQFVDTKVLAFAIESTGGWGDKFRAYFEEWAAARRAQEAETGSDGWRTTSTVIRLQQRIAVALYSSITEWLHAHFTRHNKQIRFGSCNLRLGDWSGF